MKHVIKLAPQRLAPKSMITWTVVSQLSWQYLRSSDGRLLVYHNDCQALSTAWFHPVFLLATADTCSILLKLHTHTHTRLKALFPGLPGWASTRKVKPIWILLKQETVSGSGISWAICKSAPRFRQITTPAPHHSASKHWRQFCSN